MCAIVVVVAAKIDTWLGVAAAVLAAVGLVLWLRRGPAAPGTAAAPPPAHRVLVVANETAAGASMLEALRRTAGPTEVLVVAPALTSPLRDWIADAGGARSAAEARLQRSLAELESAGFSVHGSIGDGDPLVAIEDALRTFGADEILVSTHPAGSSRWLEQDVVGRARARFALPVTHVIVDG